MQVKIPKVAAVHDMSGIGRCALTVVIPIISSMKSQVCPVPTAVLSTHTGGYTDMVFEDLTHMLTDYFAHWESIDAKLDCIYSGFMANEEQINAIKLLIERYQSKQEKPLVVVDPVMGDDGELYQTYNEAMQENMRDLVSVADVITPNLTEAYFLVKRPYTTEELTLDAAKEIAKELSEMGPKKVVLTGVPIVGGEKMNICYDVDTKIYQGITYDEVPMQYPGTGDTFTSVIVGALMQGDTLERAIERATAFVKRGAQITYKAQTTPREGILLESILDELSKENEAYKMHII